MPKLHILNGKREGEVVDVPPSPTPLVIGNRKSAQISIRDPWISWDHASVTFDGQTFWLEDLGSSNGTYVNRQKVQKVALKDQDEIYFGKTKLRFSAVDTAPATGPALAPPPMPPPPPPPVPTTTAVFQQPGADVAAAVSAATAPLQEQVSMA